MACSVFSHLLFSVLSHAAYCGQVQLCSLHKAAVAGQAYCALHERVHFWSEFKSLSCSTGSQLLFSCTRERVFCKLPLQKHCGNYVGKQVFLKLTETSRFSWTEWGCYLSQTFLAHSEKRDKSLYLHADSYICYHSASVIPEAWTNLTHVKHKIQISVVILAVLTRMSFHCVCRTRSPPECAVALSKPGLLLPFQC